MSIAAADLSYRPWCSVATQLSDDELLLLDAVFDLGRPVDCLYRDVYAQQLNTPHTHTIADDQLVPVIKLLERRGLVKRYETAGRLGANRAYVGLTASGRRLWERERAPDWSLYCLDQYPYFNGDWGVLSVLAYKKSTAEAFLRSALDRRICEHANEKRRERYKLLRDHPLVPWQREREAHVYSVVVRDPDHRSVDWEGADWDGFERDRTWWRTAYGWSTLQDRHLNTS